ncbi:MAG: hypothetical protein N4A49_02490 [Marinifilaceae bacterium]|jgi:hypothetical protein|nr:hypothetical protein [Marinifilaceae bacterium]
MIRNLLLISSFLLFTIQTNSQTIEFIKSSPQSYIWGEAKSDLLEEADNEALSQIINQISTYVTSDVNYKKQASQIKNKEIIAEDFNSVVKTYSMASLNNTHRIVISDEPEAHVFRYIKRSEIKKVFQQRKNKIKQFYQNAVQAEKDYKIADALRYYYWSALLLKTIPNSGNFSIETDLGEKKFLIAYLPLLINDIFDNLDIKLKKINKKTNREDIILSILYKNKPVTNAEFSFFTGSDWSNKISAKDGLALIELLGAECDKTSIKIKWEYIFKGEARIDRELEEVMKVVRRVPFKKAYHIINLELDSETTQLSKASVDQITETNSSLDIKAKSNISYVDNTKAYLENLVKVFDNINDKNNVAINEIFTEQGLDSYKKLIKYGNAQIIDTSNLKFFRYDDEVIARSINMSFKFKNNDKTFVENVNFSFNADNKIDDISFGLSNIALENINKRKKWAEKDRLLLIRFLETYKTAYALKRIDYLDQIFADDAIIITGRVVKKTKHNDNNYIDNEVIKYNRQTKEQFIKNLKYSFNSKEYINLKFEESKIRKSGLKGDVYGINIKQNYYSNNYGDVGYLFLMVDLNNKKQPIIHVRTWQPNSNLNEQIYNLSDF